MENPPLLHEKYETEEVTWTRGEKQSSACKDVVFALLFLAQFGGICYLAGTLGLDAYEHVSRHVKSNSDGVDFDLDYTGVGKAAGIVGGLSLVVTGLMTGVMIRFASFLIKLALIFSCVLALASVAVCAYFKIWVGAAIGALFFALSCCYAYCVWSRIDFATANMVTGLAAVKTNFGITLVGYFFSIFAFGWTVLWSVAFIGVYNSSPLEKGCVEDEDTVCDREINYGYLFLLLLSFYWAHQVFANIVQTSVAGTVGTWWFVPEEASSCCSSAVTSSVSRSCTYSFGSICFGSLLVALIQAVRALIESARQSDDANQLLVCIVDCLLSCIQGLVEYFNKWAFVYVGIYGYGYCEAGKNVMTLFSGRGWDVIIADDLVDKCLGLVNLLLAGMIGSIGLLLESTTTWFDEFKDASQIVAFVLAFLIGLVISSISLSVVNASVNSVLVLFAEAPAEFANNHPSLSSKMRAAYMKAYPDLM